MGEIKAPEDRRKKSKTCFVIAPIDKEGSDIRHRSDQLFDHVIEPAVDQFGYKALRSDKIGEPGIITVQIIEQLIKSDLVIADLTFRNPNVYYELGIRHMAEKHYIQIADPDEPIPFDVGNVRTIPVDFRFISSMEKCKAQIIEQLKVIEEGARVVSPVTFIEKLKNVQNVPEEQEKINIQFASELQSLRIKLENVHRRRGEPYIGSFDFGSIPFEVPTPSTIIDDNTTSAVQGMDIFDDLSNHGKEEVSERELIERFKIGLYRETETKKIIRRLLNAGVIYESRKGYYKKR